MRFVHLRDERVGADFRVVGFGHAKGVHALDRDAGAFKKFRRIGVRRGENPWRLSSQ